MKKTYDPKTLATYFYNAIKIQHNAFKVGFAEYKLNQSCETLISCGFCGGHRCCEKCLLQEAHMKTLEALKDPEEVQRRYERYVEYMGIHNAHTNYGANKSISKMGHITEVFHFEAKNKGD